MAEQATYLTAEGKQKLEEELEDLKVNQRKRVTERTERSKTS